MNSSKLIKLFNKLFKLRFNEEIANPMINCLLVLFLLSSPVFALEEEIPIKEVMIYNDRAQVIRKINAKFSPGETFVKIKYLPSSLEQESLRIGFSENPSLSVSYLNSYLEPGLNYKEEEFKEIKSETDKVEKTKKQLEQRMASIENSKKMLFELQNLTLETISRKVPYMKNDSDLTIWENSLTELKKQSIELEKEYNEYNFKLEDTKKSLDLLNEKLNLISSRSNKSTRITEIKVTNSSKQEASGELYINYIVNGCSWKATYNITVKENSNEAEIEYMAEIHQETGEDWNNIKVGLSTAEPRKAQIRPKIRALELYKYETETSTSYFSYGKVASEKTSAVPATTTSEAAEPQVTMEGDVSKAATSKVFHASELTSISSRKESHRILISKFSTSVKTHLYAAPKAQRNVYYIGTFTNKIPFSLIQGKVNLFKESGYIGETVMPYVSALDEFKLALGTENDIRISLRVDGQSYSEGLIKSKKIFEKKVKIKLENFSAKNRIIKVSENVPVSDTEDVEVEIDSRTTGGYSETVKGSGILQWELEVPSSSLKEIDLIYKIKVPKDSGLSF